MSLEQTILASLAVGFIVTAVSGVIGFFVGKKWQKDQTIRSHISNIERKVDGFSAYLASFWLDAKDVVTDENEVMLSTKYQSIVNDVTWLCIEYNIIDKKQLSELNKKLYEAVVQDIVAQERPNKLLAQSASSACIDYKNTIKSSAC